MRDLVIIGGGPAGMTAAVYAARKKIDVEMIAHDIGGQASWSWNVENYMGFSYIKGVELMQRFEEHMREYGFPVTFGTVHKVERTGETFVVRRDMGRETKTKVVLVTSGRSPRKLGVPGEERLIGRGMSYCATCDAPIFKGMDVAVVGGGNSAMLAAIQLLDYAGKIAIISIEDWTGDRILQEQLERNDKVTAHKYCQVTEAVGETLLESLRVRSMKDGAEFTVPAKGCFVEIGQKANSSMVRNLVRLDQQGEIVVDCSCATSAPGVFAAGDVTNVSEKQIVIAAGEGAKAALSAYEYLVRRRGKEERKAA